jgi:hypothetical protein
MVAPKLKSIVLMTDAWEFVQDFINDFEREQDFVAESVIVVIVELICQVGRECEKRLTKEGKITNLSTIDALTCALNKCVGDLAKVKVNSIQGMN